MRKRGNIIFGFIVLILVMGMGFAYLNSDLNINGITNISNASWNVYWDSVNVTEGSVTDVTTPATINTGKTEVSFNVNFTKPGDFYEFTVDAVNDGTIDAMVDSLTKGVYATNGTTPKTLPDYLTYSITYSDGIEIENNHLLKSGTTEKYKVRVSYKEDINSNQLPTTADNYMFKIGVTYKQADSNVTERASYVYTINKYNSSATTPRWNSVWLNQAFPTSITKYNTPSEALAAIKTASSKDTSVYLKHKVENGIVTESYVEFVVIPEIAAENPGMVPGTYTLRGEKTYDIDTSTYLVDESYISPYYEANKETIKTAFGYSTNPSRCTETGEGHALYFHCSVYGIGVELHANGNAVAYSSGHYGSLDCSTCYYGGSSHCNW